MEVPPHLSHTVLSPSFNDNMAEMELFVAHAHNPTDPQLNIKLFNYYKSKALEYFELIFAAAFALTPSNPSPLMGNYFDVQRQLFLTLYDRRNLLRLDYYKHLTPDILPQLITEKGYAQVALDYPLRPRDINTEHVKYLLSQNFDAAVITEEHLALLVCPETEKIQFLISNFPAYEFDFLHKLNNLEQDCKASGRVNMREIIRLFLYLAGIASLRIIPGSALPQSVNINDLLARSSPKVYLLPIETARPGLNSILYGLAEGVCVLTIPSHRLISAGGRQVCPLSILAGGVRKLGSYVHILTADAQCNLQRLYYCICQDESLLPPHKELFITVVWVMCGGDELTDFMALDDQAFVQKLLAIFSQDNPVATQLIANYTAVVLTPHNLSNAIGLITANKKYLESGGKFGPGYEGEILADYLAELQFDELLEELQTAHDNCANSVPAPDINTVIVACIYVYLHVKQY